MSSIERVFAHSIKQIFSICFLVITFFSISVFVKAQNTEKSNPSLANQQINNIQLLKLNQPIERQIKGGETHSFQLNVKAEEYARAEIEQRSIDVVVSLFAPDGELFIEMDGKNGRLWREVISCIAEKQGAYRLEIKAYGTVEQLGRYTVKLSEMRAFTPNDKKRLIAEAHLSAGRKFDSQGGAKRLEAVKEYEAAALTWRELGEGEWEAITLTNLGLTYAALSKNEQAIEALARAMELFQVAKASFDESKVSSELGSFYARLNQYDKAREFYEKALIIKREIKDRIGESEVLLNLGLISYKLAQYEQALDYYEKSLIIKREIKAKKGESIILLYIGNVFISLAQYEKARGYYEQALVISREINDRLSESFMLSNLGSIYFKLTQYEKARDYYERTLLITREIADRKAEGRMLINLGAVYNKLAQYEKARDYYEQALLISRNYNDRLGEGAVLGSLAGVHTSLVQYEKARDYYEQALVIFKEINDRRSEGETYSNLLLLHERLNNPNLIIFYGKQAINIFQEIRNNIKGLDKETQQSFLKDKELIYRKVADVLIAEGRFPEAQAVLDLLKEAEFKQFVRRSEGESLNILPYGRIEEETIKIVDRLAALGRELSELKSKPKDSLTEVETKRINEIESIEIPSANKVLRLLIESLSKVAPDVKNALDLKMKDNIQNILPALGKGVVALYTVIGKTADDNNAGNKTGNNNKINVGRILLVTPEIRNAYPIDTTDLEQTVFKLREALRSPKYDAQPVAQELYKKLFLQTSAKQKTTLAADLETYLGKEKDKTLMWSLDGVLRYVPIAALHDGNNYLVEKYRNVMFNTASLGSLKDSVKPNWEVVGLGVSIEGTVKAFDGRMLRFSALKGSETELNSIVKEKNGKDVDGIFPGTLKIDKEFTKESLFEGARTGAPVIHISSHFWYNPAREETSFLLLGNGGKLEVTEFQDYPNIFSNVDFLSLSACDTATGGNANNSIGAVAGKAEKDDNARESNGKEIEGLAYVAQTLGAKSVMASLWQVSDEGTKELMLKFYKIKKEQPEIPKGEALRQAQLSLLRGTLTIKGETEESKDKRQKGLVEEASSEGLKPFVKDKNTPFSHPYYWAPFVLIGNWK